MHKLPQVSLRQAPAGETDTQKAGNQVRFQPNGPAERAVHCTTANGQALSIFIARQEGIQKQGPAVNHKQGGQECPVFRTRNLVPTGSLLVTALRRLALAGAYATRETASIPAPRSQHLPSTAPTDRVFAMLSECRLGRSHRRVAPGKA